MPIFVLLINSLLMVKMVQYLVTLYDLTANQTHIFYICSVFTELVILMLITVASPMIMHKLAPVKVAKKELKDKDELPL